MRLKSHALCALLAILLILSTSLAVKAQPLGFGSLQEGGEGSSGMLGSSEARFVFGQVSDSSKDQFMLDTLTGRLWRIAESGKLGTYLKPVLYCAEDGQCSPLPGDGSRPGTPSKGR